jgi:TonB family protein
VIKAACVLIVAWLVIPRLRSRSAAERHTLWAAALALSTAIPLLGILLPEWQPTWARTAVDLLPAPFDYVARWTRAGGSDVVVRATGIDAGTWTSTAALAAWAAGTLLALAVIGMQWARLFRLAAAARPIADARVVRLASEVSTALQLNRPPRLLQSARLTIPVTWGGAHRARILLPAAVSRWSDERLHAVLVHEMAHVRRGDWLRHILAEIVCAIYWFNPLFLMARNELRRESERAADDVVVSAGIDGRDYAALLLDMVRTSRMPPPAGAVGMARRSDLEARIASLVTLSRNRRACSHRTAIATAALTALLGLPLGALAAPEVVAYVQVRTANLPRALMAAVSAASSDPATAVRTVRLAPPESDVSGTIAPEVVEYTTPPLYSDEARQRGVEGVVVVHARIDAAGHVRQTSVIRGLGFGLDQNALVALRQWRFRPGTRNGVPIETDIDIEIEFTLRHEALNELIANDMATQVGPGVTPPRAVVTARPPDTPRGRGRVVLDVVLLEDGRPRIVRVLRSANADLDESAVRTFEQWRFSPAVKDGMPIRVRMTAEVNFHG